MVCLHTATTASFHKDLTDRYYALLEDPRAQTTHRGRHRRSRLPGLQWHKTYDEEGKKQPRVLMIDYNERDAEGVRRVEAQEFGQLEELKGVYRQVGPGVPERCHRRP